MPCTISQLDKKRLQSLPKYPAKIEGGVAFTRYPVYICFCSSQAKKRD